MRISDWSSDVCSSDLVRSGGSQDCGLMAVIILRLGGAHDPAGIIAVSPGAHASARQYGRAERRKLVSQFMQQIYRGDIQGIELRQARSEEHTSELQSLMRNSYAVFCLKKKKHKNKQQKYRH